MTRRFNAATQPLSGTHLIEASAGTGKTYSITLLVLRQIVSAGYPIDRILVVTFTEAATSELKEKVYQRLSDALRYMEGGAREVPAGEAAVYRDVLDNMDAATAKMRIRQALLQFDRAQIFTIHGFCRRILFENAFEIGMTFGLELQKENSDFFNTLAKDFWLAYCAPRPPLLIDLFDRNGLGVKSLSRLAQLLYSKPALIVRGASGSDNGVDLYVGAYCKARKLFWECAERLPGAFQLAKGVNSKSYTKSNVPRWVAASKAFFADEKPRKLLPKAHPLERFAWDRVSAGGTGDIQIEESAFFKAVDGLVLARDRLDTAVAALRFVFAKYVDEKAAGRRELEGFVFFDDLLLEIKKALDGENGEALKRVVKARYDAALIDEFQDTDGTQYGIFKALFIDQEIPFFMIGDPKQAIYAFRGGDIFTYMDASAAVEEHTWSLGINWRSSKELVAAVNEIFSVRNPFLYDAIQFAPVASHPNGHNQFFYGGRLSPGFQFLFCERTDENCARDKNGEWKQLALSRQIHVLRVCNDIRDLLGSGATLGDEPITAGDVAVLVRSNDQAKTVRDALAQLGIAATVSQTESIFETVAASELYQILCAILDNDVSLLKTALSTNAFGIKGRALVHLANDAERIDKWRSIFAGLRQTYGAHGIVAFTEALLNLETFSGGGGLKARVLKANENEYLADFMQLLSILRKTCSAIHLPFEQLVAQMEMWLQATPTEDGFTRKIESDEAAVQIVTIHKSKGLQYPVVYLPFVFRENVGNGKEVLLYHDPEADNAEVCDLGATPDDEAIRLQVREQQSENIRLLYVALTRAKHVCKLVLGAFNGMESSSLVRLLLGSDTDAIKRMDDDALIASLETFCNKCGAALIRDNADKPVAGDPPTHGATDEQGTGAASKGELLAGFAPLQFRPFDCALSPHRGGTSFSSLIFSSVKNDAHTHGANAHSRWMGEDGGGVMDDANVNGANVNGANVSGANVNIEDRNENNSDYSEGFLGMHPEFGRGAWFGTLVHDIFEERFRERTTKQNMGELVGTVLSRHGLKGKLPEDVMTAWIADLFNVPLHDSVDLETVLKSEHFLPELEFVMPIARSADFSPQRLSVAMGTDTEKFMARYASRLQTLQFSTFSAYLKGFVDLVFEQNGKYYIVDYKTNDLGSCKSKYNFEALKEDMALHHYFLQYHLYALALHRYLSLRLPDYSYETHFGGVYYLYVRGMSSMDRSSGIFYDRPPFGRVAALDSLLRGLEVAGA